MAGDAGSAEQPTCGVVGQPNLANTLIDPQASGEFGFSARQPSIGVTSLCSVSH
jgi:hypothetical protein